MIVNNVGIEGITTVVPERITYFADDAKRLNIGDQLATRISNSVGVSQRHTAP